MSTADNLLRELTPLIPGQWHLSEKLRFEKAFRTQVGAALEKFAREAADKRERDLVQGLYQFEGWHEEISRLVLLMSKDPTEPLIMHIGRVLSSFLRRAGAQTR